MTNEELKAMLDAQFDAFKAELPKGITEKELTEKLDAFKTSLPTVVGVTKEEIENAGHKTIEVNSTKDDKIIRDILCIDGDEKKIRLDLVRNNKVRRKFLF